MWTHVPESGKWLTHRRHVLRKTDTVWTQSKRGVASYFKENRHSTEKDTTVIEMYLGDVHT